MLTITKEYQDIPFGHRQYRHDGHCRWVHGHNLNVRFTFAAHQRDDNGFIIDFGKLGELKKLLTETFDHTLLISPQDPELAFFREMEKKGLCDLRVIDGSAESIAEYIYTHSKSLIFRMTDGRAWVHAVQVWEDSKNSAVISK